MLGLNIIVVTAGTEIDGDQERLTVDDQNCVQLGDTLYVTAQTAVAVGLHSRTRHPATNIGE